MNKYGFKIKTRNGLILDSLTVQACNRADAERRITQVYHYCQIMESTRPMWTRSSRSSAIRQHKRAHQPHVS